VAPSQVAIDRRKEERGVAEFFAELRGAGEGCESRRGGIALSGDESLAETDQKPQLASHRVAIAGTVARTSEGVLEVADRLAVGRPGNCIVTGALPVVDRLRHVAGLLRVPSRQLGLCIVARLKYGEQTGMHRLAPALQKALIGGVPYEGM